MVWDHFDDDPSSGTTYVSNFNDIRITNDGMVFTIAFVPKDTDIPMPPGPEARPSSAPPTRDRRARRADRFGAEHGARRRPPHRRPAHRPAQPRRTAAAGTGVDHAGPRHQHRLMRAVVLVGGFGTRLRPLTNTIPKPMLPVAHVPIDRAPRSARSNGAVSTRVTLALGLPARSRSSTPSPTARCGGVALDYAVEPEPLDTAGAIRFAADHAGIDDTFVVANGDVLTDLDIAALVAVPSVVGAEATIHLIAVDDPSAFGVVDRDAVRPGPRASSRSRRPAPSRAT